MTIHDMGVCLLSHCYEALDVCNRSVAEVGTQLERELKLFELIEVVNIYQICLKGFVKEKVYDGSSRF